MVSEKSSGPAREVGRRLRERGERLAVAESCTGGLLAARLTAVDGASDWMWGGTVVYTADAKARLAGLEPRWLEEHGTVGRETTRALARAARRRSGSVWGVAVTGWAGPTGDTPEDPVGTVYVAVDGPVDRLLRRGLEGDREAVRAAAVDLALEELLEALRRANGPPDGPGGQGAPGGSPGVGSGP